VGASRGAADDLARSIAATSGATFGLTRFSFTELAARAAVARRSKHAPGTQAGAEATAARVVFDARAESELEYVEPVATLPGVARALARTLHERRLARVGAAALERGDEPGLRDLARLLTRLEAQLELAAVDDRAALFAAAAAGCREGRVRWARLPILLVDIPLDSP